MRAAAEIDKPGGRPVAENVKVSPASGSEKFAATLNETVAASTPLWFESAVEFVHLVS